MRCTTWRLEREVEKEQPRKNNVRKDRTTWLLVRYCSFTPHLLFISPKLGTSEKRKKHQTTEALSFQLSTHQKHFLTRQANQLTPPTSWASNLHRPSTEPVRCLGASKSTRGRVNGPSKEQLLGVMKGAAPGRRLKSAMRNLRLELLDIKMKGKAMRSLRTYYLNPLRLFEACGWYDEATPALSKARTPPWPDHQTMSIRSLSPPHACFV